MQPIHAEHLSRAFGDLTAVDGLTFSVAAGEIFALVGPDGAGKTTTMRLLGSILEPTAGDAWVAGFHVLHQAEAVKECIGYMSQRFGLYPDLTVMENILFYADIYDVSRRERAAKIERLLAFSNLAPFKRRLAGNLSGGMKQKLGLVCALVHTPRVLLLDEPTNGVDPVSRRDFWRILYQLREEKVAVCVSTAYLDEAERADRVALVSHGRLLACGTPDEVKQLMHGTILEIRTARPRAAAARLRPRVAAQSIGLFGDRLHLVTTQPEEAAAQVQTVLASAGMPAAEVRVVAPSLEDVFVSVVGESEASAPGGQLQGGVPLGASEGDSPIFGLPGKESPADQKSGQSPPAVVVHDLEKRFGDFVAVNRISFQVARGEIFGFLGPNGAGKSTTIRMLCGILRPSGGSGAVAGFDVGTQPEIIKLHIGYMSQRFSLYEDLTVEENIDFYSGIYRLSAEKKKRRKQWVIEMAGLADHRRSRTSTLSSGWKQRLALGCAILHQPPILFLDEPTSGVDPISRRAFWDLIYSMADEGVTIFVTTHYMDEAEYCDRLGLIYRGEMIALGAPQALKSQTACPAAAHPADVSLEDVFVALIEAHDRAGQPQEEVKR